MRKKSVSSSTPGRPRQFDKNEALDKATAVFADKGYEATSLDDLTKAMGINRTSMYLAFGNKEALFKEAIKRYADIQAKNIAACLADRPARDGVENLMRAVVNVITNKDSLGTCFMTEPPLSAEHASDETRRMVEQKRSLFEHGMRERIEQAVKTKELPKNVIAEDLARFFALLIQGFAVQIQHGATKSELMRAVDVAMSAFPLTKN